MAAAREVLEGERSHSRQHERRAKPLKRRQPFGEEQHAPRQREDRLNEQQNRRLERGQPRQRRRNQQPADHLRHQREQGEPRVGRPRRREREARVEGRAQQRADGHAGRRVEQRTRRRGERPVRRAEHQQKDGVTSARKRPERDTGDRRRPVRVRSGKARCQRDAHEDGADDDGGANSGTLTVEDPRHRGDDHDLHVGENGCEPDTDERDRLVPESELDPENHAARERQQSRASRARIAAARERPHHRQHRKCVGRAKQRGGHRRDGSEPHEYRRKGDAQNP